MSPGSAKAEWGWSKIEEKVSDQKLKRRERVGLGCDDPVHIRVVLIGDWKLNRREEERVGCEYGERIG